ncbi:MAG TPA: Rrf2 family transcriptional regulator [Spirochaetota bacterium]|nr:Rrf2 family transcriptional regulator [Spirochaetota bacterium]
MRLSTRSRYAIRSLLDLIYYYKGSPVSIKEIAERQQISERYLENIFHDLRKNKIVNSIKGKNGGFMPGTDLKEVKLLTIIEILEGPVKIVDCTAEPSDCPRIEKCSSHPVWLSLNNIFRDTLSKIKLGDIKGCEEGSIQELKI